MNMSTDKLLRENSFLDLLKDNSVLSKKQFSLIKDISIKKEQSIFMKAS